MKLLLPLSSMLIIGSVAMSYATENTPALSPAIGVGLPSFSDPYRLSAEGVSDIYVTGVMSGLAYAQSNAFASDKTSQLDFSNAQLIVQKPEGLVQFYAQFGGYSLPALGTAYLRADEASDLYSWMPQAYLKLQPSEYVSLQLGKLPTLIGAEYTFTFQNANIQRGLLWNQENAVVHGAQLI